MHQLPSRKIREYISSQDPTISMDANICLTINVNADNGSEFWMQLHYGMINFRH
jgi:hypothetical protein